MAEYYAVTDLGTLPGGASSTAWDINDLGQVVGSSDAAGGQVHAFLWATAAQMQDLGTLPGGSSSQASGISVCGQVAGQSDLQVAAAKPMRLFGSTAAESKISARCQATMRAPRLQSMRVGRRSEIRRSQREAGCGRLSGIERREWLVLEYCPASRTLERTISTTWGRWLATAPRLA